MTTLPDPTNEQCTAMAEAMAQYAQGLRDRGLSGAREDMMDALQEIAGTLMRVYAASGDKPVSITRALVALEAGTRLVDGARELEVLL